MTGEFDMRDDDITPATDLAPATDASTASAEQLGASSGAGARDAGAVRRERELQVSSEEAWPLVGTREGLEQWLGDEVDVDLVPGASGTIRDGEEVLQAEVESIEPGRRVSLRWWSEERGATIVDLTLEPLDERRTRLVVIEVPARALIVPNMAPFGNGAGPSAGPQLRAPRALALA